MDLWTFIWVFLGLLVIVTILESIHRSSRNKRALLENRMMQEQIRAQQPYAVYTIEGNGRNVGGARLVTNNNHINYVTKDDLPPKYEDVVVPTNDSTPPTQSAHILNEPSVTPPPEFATPLQPIINQEGRQLNTSTVIPPVSTTIPNMDR